MKRYVSWKELGVAYSLANLFFIISWKELVIPVTRHYFRPEKPSSYEHVALLADVFLLTIVFLGLMQIAKSLDTTPVSKLFHALFLVIGLFALGPLSFELMNWFDPEADRFVNYYVPAAVFLICFGLAYRKRFEISAIVENFKLFTIFLLPFTIWLTLQSFSDQFFGDPQVFLPHTVHESKEKASETTLKSRVVWIIFDGLDYAALSAAYRNGTDVEEIKRFSDQSVVASNAFAPNNRTQDSISALLTGVPLLQSSAMSPNDLMLFPFDKSQPFNLRDSNDIFRQVKKRGGKSAIAGWYHPYCRVFQDRVSQCYSSPLNTSNCSDVAAFSQCSQRAFFRALEEVPLVPHFLTSLHDRNQEFIGETYDVQFQRNEDLRSLAEGYVADPKINLSFLHFSIPHFPLITRSRHSDDADYYTSLEVVNENLGRLRRALEDAHQWDETTVIISSDHYYRFKGFRDFSKMSDREKQESILDRRIPFLIKLAGQKNRIDYEPTLNTVVTSRIILDIFDGRITRADDLVAWLENLAQERPDLIRIHNRGPKF